HYKNKNLRGKNKDGKRDCGMYKRYQYKIFKIRSDL
ncbi:unnamed protein product, partial [marine sediment metagenome]